MCIEFQKSAWILCIVSGGIISSLGTSGLISNACFIFIGIKSTGYNDAGGTLLH